MQIPQSPDRKIVQYSFAAYLLLLFLLYFDAFRAMFRIWTSSEAFAYGAIVFPVVLYLLWRKRDDLLQMQFVPDARISILILLLSFVVLVSQLLSVDIAQQLATVILIPCGVYAFLGRDAFFKLAFPLLFLLFAVPVGQDLMSVLQIYTAQFAVWTAELFGYPATLVGRFLETANGKFEILTISSGARYLVASLAVGCLYAYLQFRALKNRLLIILLSALLPIVANAIRAIVILLLVHYSEGRWGIGADQLYYG